MEIARCGDNVKFRHENIMYTERWLAHERKRRRLESDRAALQAKRKPRRHLPLADDEFLPHMRELKDRHKCEVLDGPSQYGKATFCKMLTANVNEYLEYDCLGLKSPPNLKMLLPETRLINFDEASVTWALQNKKLLQGPEAPLTMGDSTTGCHSYTVELHGIMMVICSSKVGRRNGDFEYKSS